jgi:hypothetical protein
MAGRGTAAQARKHRGRNRAAAAAITFALTQRVEVGAQELRAKNARFGGFCHIAGSHCATLIPWVLPGNHSYSA